MYVLLPRGQAATHLCKGSPQHGLTEHLVQQVSSRDKAFPSAGKSALVFNIV